MHLSEKYAVPAELALLYEFVNSLDQREYVENGAELIPADEFSTKQKLENWLHARHLLDDGVRLDPEEYHKILGLREALRSFLQFDPSERVDAIEATAALNSVLAGFPFILEMEEPAALTLRSQPGANCLSRVLAELHHLSQTNRLDRLKMCASDKCRWVFFDRSRPHNRRWCSSARCGNREKTRAYRLRQREET